MSTRAQIGFYESVTQKIEKPEVMIYKHSDGYPNGVLPLLEEFCTKYAKSRGLSDTEYAGAWYLYALIDEHVKSMKELAKNYPSLNRNKDGHDYLGHGICKVFHGDIEYFYRVHPNEIMVYETHGDKTSQWKHINTITIKAA